MSCWETGALTDQAQSHLIEEGHEQKVHIRARILMMRSPSLLKSSFLLDFFRNLVKRPLVEEVTEPFLCRGAAVGSWMDSTSSSSLSFAAETAGEFPVNGVRLEETEDLNFAVLGRRLDSGGSRPCSVWGKGCQQGSRCQLHVNQRIF